MRSICVFCGSRPGRSDHYRDMAAMLGTRLAEADYGLVYGGGRIGLMGALADAALSAGGRVTGVIPEQLMRREVAHSGLYRLEVVGDMLVRKQRMIELSNAFIPLPGGLGTLDELFEVLTWFQLGMHEKPMLLVDDSGYYDSLMDWLKTAEDEGFLRPEDREALRLCASVDEAIRELEEMLS